MIVTEAIGGIPEDIFRGPGTGEIKGLISGRDISYSFQDRRIAITDTELMTFHFYATVNDNGVMELIIRTRGFDASEGENGQTKHPDLFARELVIRSLQYFRERDLEITGVAGKWWLNATSDNGQQFSQNLAQGQSKAEAAAGTWTGKLAAELGFPQVKYVFYEGDPQRGKTLKAYVLFSPAEEDEEEL